MSLKEAKQYLDLAYRAAVQDKACTESIKQRIYATIRDVEEAQKSKDKKQARKNTQFENWQKLLKHQFETNSRSADINRMKKQLEAIQKMEKEITEKNQTTGSPDFLNL